MLVISIESLRGIPIYRDGEAIADICKDRKKHGINS
jgi:hypothetical protein